MYLLICWNVYTREEEEEDLGEDSKGEGGEEKAEGVVELEAVGIIHNCVVILLTGTVHMVKTVISVTLSKFTHQCNPIQLLLRQ